MLTGRVHSGCQLAVSSGRAGRRSGTGARRSRPPVWRSVRVFGCWSYSGGPTASTSRSWRSPRGPSRGRVSTTRANATAVTSWLGRRDAVPTRARNRRTAVAEGRAPPGGLVETPKCRSANPEAEMWQPGGRLLALVCRCGEPSVVGWLLTDARAACTQVGATHPAARTAISTTAARRACQPFCASRTKAGHESTGLSPHGKGPMRDISERRPRIAL
jgi:hypothetical protein